MGYIIILTIYLIISIAYSIYYYKIKGEKYFTFNRSIIFSSYSKLVLIIITSLTLFLMIDMDLTYASVSFYSPHTKNIISQVILLIILIISTIINYLILPEGVYENGIIIKEKLLEWDSIQSFSTKKHRNNKITIKLTYRKKNIRKITG